MSKIDRAGGTGECGEALAELRLLQLADSALPIGGLAHSFGLESLVAGELLSVGDLPEFFSDFLEEAGLLEAVFCREGWRLGWRGLGDSLAQEGSPQRLRPCPDAMHGGRMGSFVGEWVALNERVSAVKPARESRAGSASLGKNFLAAVARLGDFAMVREALRASKEAGGLVHHSAAFGLVGAAIGIAEDRAVTAYLHQTIAGLVSACQRLLPLGQSTAMKILWELKPATIETAAHSAHCALDDASCFLPMLEWGAMEHPGLTTRLFIS